MREDAEGDAYLTDNMIERLQTAYEDTLDFLLTVQAELEAAEPPTLPTGPPIASSSLTLEHRAAKLPKLDLPTFSSQYEDWENFCDLFTTLVHNAPGLADATKLQYLKTCLKGAAADLVKDVTTMNANYVTTWQALKARFHNPRLIVYKHLRALMDMPFLKKESATELRSFADEAQRIVRALSNLQMPVDHWDVWLVYILAARLDSDSQKAWETDLSVLDRRMVLNNVSDLGNVSPLDRFPKFVDLSEFLEKRVQALSMIALNASKTEKKPSALPRPVPGSRRVSGFHSKEKGSVEAQRSREDKASTSSGVNIHTARVVSRKYMVLLATAQLMLVGPHGVQTRVRALLDQGSQSSFVSESVANLLGLQKRRVDVPLVGLGAKSAGTAHQATSFKIISLIDPLFQVETNALILSKLTSQLPARCPMELDLGMFAGLSLADPQFHITGSVDVILGADVYGQLLRSGLRSFPPSSLVAQETVLGWIVSGPVLTVGSRRAVDRGTAPLHALHCAREEDIDESLQRFWTLEELPTVTASLRPLDEACEKLFRDSHVRNSDGRFIVRLPLKSEPPAVGPETRRMALGSLMHMYRRFARDPRIASAYREFMAVYEKLGHMERVPASELDNPRAWYLPHHAVVQSTPSNWKIRVVFDASRKTREGQCLNDFLLAGPALQRDLSLILLNWRRYRFVFTADVVKMFRQIRVSRGDQDFQRIVWAPSSSETPVEYRLTTVTYGTACAPYLAIRTLLQLAEEERSHFPLGARCLESNTYVDDTFAGADELAVAVNIRQELIALLRSAGVELDKWAANHPDLLPFNMRQSGSDDSKSISFDESVKTLGVQWNPGQDEFRFTTLDFKSLSGAVTKRSVLSSIARLFDPLGWLAPITIAAKILMQDLWILKCEWDSALPVEVRDRWLEYSADKELRAMFTAASDFYKSVAATLANDGTSWTFIPPNSPHYGGLWEAGVRSVKHHLKRAIGDRPLTFEEFSTVLVEIEACLNSRPLCPLSADIEDLQALTPAHFLGVASGLVPDEPPPDVSENRLERFQLLQSIQNNFWKRWSEEYLQYLQERAKWRGPTDNFAVGQLVLVRDDRYPPSKWPLGRITEVHLGPDGLVRVVTVRTATSILKRHVARLCPLWLDKNSPKVVTEGTPT
ncbi:uncharacterized protein LOC123987780 [Osmia bicornis bicornis]|uniref:uncharacterized protein LOC123987780 n=1 Tax=Osmia bicornis bicornis TaxID=1437191 RepID=UPI001EAF2F1C|nr:uncharacterized protein LOC123987780 [Osmia bicornis bicornis]